MKALDTAINYQGLKSQEEAFYQNVSSDPSPQECLIDTSMFYSEGEMPLSDLLNHAMPFERNTGMDDLLYTLDTTNI